MATTVANLRLARDCFENVIRRNPAHLVAAQFLHTVLSELGDDMAAGSHIYLAEPQRMLGSFRLGFFRS